MSLNCDFLTHGQCFLNELFGQFAKFTFLTILVSAVSIEPCGLAREDRKANDVERDGVPIDAPHHYGPIAEVRLQTGPVVIVFIIFTITIGVTCRCHVCILNVRRLRSIDSCTGCAVPRCFDVIFGGTRQTPIPRFTKTIS